MIVYGMAFDFFNVSGSLFTEMEAHPSIRASAQGLFFMMTNGVGAIIGGYASGAVVDAFSVYAGGGGLVSRDWTPVWFIFAGYALVIGLLFGIVFRYKHNPEKQRKQIENLVDLTSMKKKKIELQVLNISNSQAQAGAYALVLGEVDGKRQLPIIIGATEAQAMIIEMKGIVPPRPLTHNLFASVLKCWA